MIRSYILIGNEEDLAAELVPSATTSPAKLSTNIDLTNPISLKEITKIATQDLERQIILKVLEANGWSRRKTAKWLNISYRSLLYKLQELEVRKLLDPPPKSRNSASISIPSQAATTPEEIESMLTRRELN
jgi:two-component system response regulator AtoC